MRYFGGAKQNRAPSPATMDAPSFADASAEAPWEAGGDSGISGWSSSPVPAPGHGPRWDRGASGGLHGGPAPARAHGHGAAAAGPSHGHGFAAGGESSTSGWGSALGAGSQIGHRESGGGSGMRSFPPPGHGHGHGFAAGTAPGHYHGGHGHGFAAANAAAAHAHIRHGHGFAAGSSSAAHAPAPVHANSHGFSAGTSLPSEYVSFGGPSSSPSFGNTSAPTPAPAHGHGRSSAHGFADYYVPSGTPETETDRNGQNSSGRRIGAPAHAHAAPRGSAAGFGSEGGARMGLGGRNSGPPSGTSSAPTLAPGHGHGFADYATSAGARTQGDEKGITHGRSFADYYAASGTTETDTDGKGQNSSVRWSGAPARPLAASRSSAAGATLPPGSGSGSGKTPGTPETDMDGKAQNSSGRWSGTPARPLAASRSSAAAATLRPGSGNGSGKRSQASGAAHSAGFSGTPSDSEGIGVSRISSGDFRFSGGASSFGGRSLASSMNHDESVEAETTRRFGGALADSQTIGGSKHSTPASSFGGRATRADPLEADTLKKFSKKEPKREQTQELVESVRRDLERRMSGLEGKLSSSPISAMQASLTELKTDIQKLKDAMEGLKSKSSSHEWTISQLRNDVTAQSDFSTSRIESLRADLDRLDQKSAFFTIYKTVPPPKDKDEIFNALDRMLTIYVDEKGLSEKNCQTFLEDLRDNVRRGDKPKSMSDVQWTGMRLWTSDDLLKGPEKSLSNIVTEMNYTDNIRMLMQGGMTLQKAMNDALVTRGSPTHKFPPDGKSHRGTGIPIDELSFWQVGKRYRAAAPLATSFTEEVAQTFLGDVDYVSMPKREPVHFIFDWPTDDRGNYTCEHAYYVDDASAVKGEKEIVLAGYSVFEVKSVSLQPYATVPRPHVITVKVMPDNRLHPEYLPIAKWH